jgi:hypothetical protein
MHAKDLYFIFRKSTLRFVVGAINNTVFVPTHPFMLFQWQSNIFDPFDPSLSSSLTRLTLLWPHLWPGWPFSELISIYSFYILLNLFSSWIQLKYCSLDIKQQSINQSYDIILAFVFLPSYTRKYWVTTSFHHKSGRLGP